MRNVWILAMKDLRLLSRDKASLFFIIVFPVGMGIFFGFIGASYGEESDGRIRLALVDEDQSAVSQQFASALDEVGAITVVPFSYDEAMDRVRRGKLAGYVRLAKGFGQTAGILWSDPPQIEIGIDPGRRTEGFMIEGFVMQAMGDLVQARFADPEGMRAQINRMRENLNADKEVSPSKRIVLMTLFASLDSYFGSLGVQSDAGETDNGSAPQDPSTQLASVNVIMVTASSGKREQLTRKLRSRWDMSFPPAIMWGAMGCVAGFAVSIAKERSEGTFLRLSIAPLSRMQILAGKGLACLLSVLGVVTMMMVLAVGLGIQLQSLPLLVLAAVFVGLSFAGLTMFMAVLGRTEQAVGGAGWAMIVVMAMFGGGMVPLVFLPSFMRTISDASPFKWGILALEGAIWRGFTLGEMLVPCAVLLGIGILSFAVGARVLSRQRI